MSEVGINEVIRHVLSSEAHYPGPHQRPCPRTSSGVQVADAQRQMTIIWAATKVRLMQLLETGTSVSIHGFGLFTFHLSHRSRDDGATVQIRTPTFVADRPLASRLRSDGGSRLIVRGPNDGSLFSVGARGTLMLNAVPIAASTFYAPNVVRSALSSIFEAISNLVARDNNVHLDFGFCRWRVTGGKLSVVFDRELARAANSFKRSKSLTGAVDATHSRSQALLIRPDGDLPARRQKTMLLSQSSKDMSSVLGR